MASSHTLNTPQDIKCALDRPKDVLKMSSQKRMMKVPKIDGNSIRTHKEWADYELNHNTRKTQ